MTDTAQNIQNTENTDTTEASVESSTEDVKSSQATSQPTASSITREDLDAALGKAREQEKSKLYKKLEGSVAKTEELQKQLEDREKVLADLQSKMDLAENSKLSDQEKIQKKLDSLESRNTSLSDQLEKVASEAAARIQESELKAYRNQKLRESGVSLTELVTGNNAEEIDAAIVATLEREKEIFAKAEEKIRAQHQSNAPKPVAPVAPPTEPGILANVDRRSVARLDDAEYQKVRAKLMEEAKRASRA